MAGQMKIGLFQDLTHLQTVWEKVFWRFCFQATWGGQHCYQALCHLLLERRRPPLQVAPGSQRQDLYSRDHHLKGLHISPSNPPLSHHPKALSSRSLLPFLLTFLGSRRNALSGKKSGWARCNWRSFGADRHGEVSFPWTPAARLWHRSGHHQTWHVQVKMFMKANTETTQTWENVLLSEKSPFPMGVLLGYGFPAIKAPGNRPWLALPRSVSQSGVMRLGGLTNHPILSLLSSTLLLHKSMECMLEYIPSTATLTCSCIVVQGWGVAGQAIFKCCTRAGGGWRGDMVQHRRT